MARRYTIDRPMALWAMRGGLRPYRRPEGMMMLAALGHEDRIGPANARYRNTTPKGVIA